MVVAGPGQPHLGVARSGHRPADRRGQITWALFEWARNPYVLLITIYVFAPYFARDIIGADIMASGELEGMDPETARQVAGAKGQAVVASLSKWAGAIAALTAPFLGAAFDRGLRRKPLLILFLGVLSVLSFLLWWAVPGESGFSTGTIIAILIAAYVTYTFSEVTHNSMLPDAARPSALPAVSGFGLALGNAAATLLFVAIVFMFALPDMLNWPFAEPLFGIDTARYQHFRIAGPICAVWLAVMIVPFFLYAKDTGVKGTPFFPSVKEGAAGVVRTVRKAAEYREAFKFLIARTIYADGMFALLALAAVYVSLFLGWGIVELPVYAIWASIW
ncbi:MFS transporter, partial [Thalassobaculum salexigens]|uniref:MFS transporter n=1 Tax=Thalassobaculum salexigens TaxID=455360 RepID=UPI003CD0E065